MNLLWTAPFDGNSTITSYTVEYKLDTDGSFTVAGSTTDLNYIVGGLLDNRVYSFRVLSTNVIGDSLYSNVYEDNTLAVNPDAIDDLNAVPAEEAIVFDWTAPYNGGLAITSYEGEFKKTSDSLWTFGGSTPNLFFTLEGLEGGVSYDARAKAVNAVGKSAYSNVATGTTLEAPSAPLPINDLSITNGNTEVTLDWSAPSDGGSAITGYNVYKALASDGIYSLYSNVAVLTETVTGLTNGIAYLFKVHAVNAVGESLSSNVVSATPVGSSLGPELVTNPDFDSATGWILSTGFTISGGQLSVASGDVATNFDSGRQNVAFTESKVYRIVIDIASVDDFGQSGFRFGGEAYKNFTGAGIVSSGVHSMDYTASASSAGLFRLYTKIGFGFVHNSISIKEIL